VAQAKPFDDPPGRPAGQGEDFLKDIPEPTSEELDKYYKEKVSGMVLGQKVEHTSVTR